MQKDIQIHSFQPFIKVQKIAKTKETHFQQIIPKNHGSDSHKKTSRVEFSWRKKFSLSVHKKEKNQKQKHQEISMKINQSIEYNLSHLQVYQKNKKKARSLATLKSQPEDISFSNKKKKISEEKRRQQAQTRKGKKPILTKPFEPTQHLKSLKKKVEQYKQQSFQDVLPFMTSVKSHDLIKPAIKLNVPAISNLIRSEDSRFFNYEPRYKEMVKEFIRQNVKISEKELKFVDVSEKSRYIQKMKNVRKGMA